MKSATLILSALLVLVMLALAWRQGARYDNYLTGLWAGNAEFLERARLGDMQLYLGPCEGGKRAGWLLMSNLDGEHVANQSLVFRARRRPFSALAQGLKSSADACRGSVEIEYEGSGPMPASMQLKLSQLDGTLVLYDETKVYALLEKDSNASAAAAAATSGPA